MKRLEKKKKDFRRIDPSLERLFIALQPPLELRRAIAKNNNIFTKDLRNFSFTEQDQIHITLKFLGDGVSLTSKEAIIQLLEQMAPELEAPVVKVEKMYFGFPKQMIPRVLYYNIEANRSMQQLTKVIHEQIMELELSDVKREKDYKKMVYHLTIARAKHNSHRSFGRRIRELINKEAQPIDIEFVPETMYLIKSTLHHKAHPRYEVIAQFPLKQPH